MCRPNQLRGYILLSVGCGMVLGVWMSSAFLTYCIAGVMVFAGVSVVRR